MYFSGNQPAFGQRFLIKTQKSEAKPHEECLKLISIPRFRETGIIVLLDMTSLEAFTIRLVGDDPIVASNEASTGKPDVVMIDMSSAASPTGLD